VKTSGLNNFLVKWHLEKLIEFNLVKKEKVDNFEAYFDSNLKCKNYEIIHSSGLLIKKMKIFYECYLNMNQTDNEYKDLKGSLNKIRNIPLEVKIEEISLKSVKRL